MEKIFSLEELIEKVKALTPFEKLELTQIIGDFELNMDYKEALAITTPNVKEIVESYISKPYSERMEITRVVDCD